MNILIISEFFPATPFGDFRGGVENRNFAISRYLARHNNVWVIASHEFGKPREQVLEHIKVLRVGVSRFYTRKAGVLSRLSFMVAAVFTGVTLNIDLVEGAGFFGFIPAFIIAIFKKKKKTLFFPDVVASYAYDVGNMSYLALHLLERIIFRLPWDGVICISDEVKKKIRRIGINAKRIETIYCGIDLKIIDRVRAKKKKFPTISCVSRIVSYKRIDDLVNALALVSKRYPHIICSIVGEGEELNHIKRMTLQKGLLKNITFHGFLPKYQDVIRIIKSSHLFCLPSTVEGFGIVPIEAMAAGVPVILADTLVSREVTKSRAIYFSPQRADDLAKKILLVLDKPELRLKYSALGYSLAKNYQWSDAAKQTEKFYENLCGY